MVPHSISGPSCESLNVVVFAIRHSRQCKIRYHVEGHFLLINQSNDFFCVVEMWKSYLIMTEFNTNVAIHILLIPRPAISLTKQWYTKLGQVS